MSASCFNMDYILLVSSITCDIGFGLSNDLVSLRDSSSISSYGMFCGMLFLFRKNFTLLAILSALVLGIHT